MAELERASAHPTAHAEVAHADAHAGGAHSGGDVVPAAHPHERPEDWGWHADLGKPARIAGWLSVVALLLMVTATHYNLAGTAALLMTAAALAGGLLFDAHRRRTAWRR
jgi:Protein of unknown function (DUF2631)